jgi:hypothetical protein
MDGQACASREHQMGLCEAGIEFIPENGGGVGLRLRKRAERRDEGLSPDQLTAENDG